MPLIKLLPSVQKQISDAELVSKIKDSSAPKKSNSNNIINIIENIRKDVEQHLGEYKNKFQLITTVEDLDKYIAKANDYGYIAIDTETTGLDEYTLQIVGVCLYFPGEKGAYVPINHIDYFTGEHLPNQLTEEQVASVLKKLTAKVIMHNAPFDIRVILHTLHLYIHCYWDILAGGFLLNENESHKLKDLHSKYISHKEEKTFKDYFGNITFNLIPIEFAYLYAVNDAVDTFDLYEFQARFLNDTSDRQDRTDLYWLFRNIEMPMIDVIINLEENGVAVDLDYVNTLKDVYGEQLKNAKDKCYKEFNQYIPLVEKWNSENIRNKIDLPINLNSPKQLAILFYDILKAKANGESRSTDDEALSKMKKKYPLAEYILDYRGLSKMTSTYIYNIEDIVNKDDNRIHTHFKSMGAVTGRMSSKNPINLQNIPSHNNDIRKMFIGQITYNDTNIQENNTYTFNKSEEVELADGTWKWVELLKVGDIIDSKPIKSIKVNEFTVEITF